jgi:hypothetical protein
MLLRDLALPFPSHEWPSAGKPFTKEVPRRLSWSSRSCKPGVREDPLPPAVFHIGLVKEGCPFLGKRKPSMGLSFQMGLADSLGLSGTGCRLEMS